MKRKKIEKIVSIFASSPGYLLQTGWLRSLAVNRAVDADGEPVPWITYPAIDFLADRITSSMTVFEYGSGNSTLWWSARVAALVSCEHDKEWYSRLSPQIPKNTSYILRRAKGGSTDYFMEITKYTEMFDIVVIDGRQRVSCVLNSLVALRRDGVIIWDNSDREEYREGYDFLAAANFKRLDFWGMGPLATRRWCTSVFYRRENCLGI